MKKIKTIILIIALILTLSACISRKAENKDVFLTEKVELSLSLQFAMIPNENIKNLEIDFSFYNNSQIITTKKRILGNVTKGMEYTITFYLSEFSFSQFSFITKYSYTVTSGTVSASLFNNNLGK